VDALSRNPCVPAPTEEISESEVQVASIRESSVECNVDDISVLLKLEPNNDSANPEVLTLEQKKDQHIVELLTYLKIGALLKKNSKLV